MPGSEPQHYQPQWARTIASPTEPDDAVEVAVAEAKDGDSLNRLQRSLIWFAAILTAISIFINIRNQML